MKSQSLATKCVLTMIAAAALLFACTGNDDAQSGSDGGARNPDTSGSERRTRAVA